MAVSEVNKEVYVMADLVKMFGVHRNTIIRKTKNVSFFFTKSKKKWYYTPEEVEVIKTLFK